MYKSVFNITTNYLCHYNKNHDPKNGRFTYGDGNGDGISGTKTPKNQNDKKVEYNKDGHKKGVYSAKIENYHPGTAFSDPYYIDKNGRKRSYTSYKDMPVEAQAAEKARAEGKKKAKEFGGTAVNTLTNVGLDYVAKAFL